PNSGHPSSAGGRERIGARSESNAIGLSKNARQRIDQPDQSMTQRAAENIDIGRVVVWMGGALLSFSVMAVSIRALAATFSVFEILAVRSAGGLIVLAAALGFALAAIAVKKLIATETTFAILFFMNAMQLPMNLAGSSATFLGKIEPANALPLIGVAIAGLSSHYCLTNALRAG